MKNALKWLRNNKLATFCIFCLSYILHYTIETFVISNILALGGLTFPTLTII